jgi:hypothetical protein
MAMCSKACTVRNLLAAEVAVSNTARGMNVYHLQSVRILNLSNVNQLIFVMVKYGVLFEVRTEFLNNI